MGARFCVSPQPSKLNCFSFAFRLPAVLSHWDPFVLSGQLLASLLSSQAFKARQGNHTRGKGAGDQALWHSPSFHVREQLLFKYIVQEGVEHAPRPRFSLSTVLNFNTGGEVLCCNAGVSRHLCLTALCQLKKSFGGEKGGGGVEGW